MNELKIGKSNTITTLEVAEMMGMRHQKILEKLEGSKDGKTIGVIPILTEHDFVLSDYFTESTYKDGSGKTNKCYNVTKLGCDFLANKFTGEKGIIFTAKYVKRFRDMETVILSDEQLKANLLLEIYKGGQSGILASKQLTDIEVKTAIAPLVSTIEEQKPMVDFANHVTETADTIDVGELSKIVKNEKIDIGRNRLFEYLRKNKILMSNNIPYQIYMTKKWFEVIETTKQTAYGSKVFSKVLVTGKGQVSIVEMVS